MQDDPLSELFGMLGSQMVESARGVIKDGWMTAELGTMTNDMGLKLDRFKHVVYDYLLSHHLTLAEPDFTNTEIVGGGGGYAEFAPHSHPVITPEQLLPLHPGDRVLVQPVNGGQDFVIVARVKPRG